MGDHEDAAARRGDSCARSSARSGIGVTGAVLSGLLWQAGAVAAPLVVKYAIDHGIVADATTTRC